jgi:exopolysaccharide production protein ExoZ
VIPWLRQTFELQDPAHARLLPMEGLRGVAVTLVFLQHYSVQAQLIGLSPGPAAAVAAAFRNYGNQGVELFFVLSGYLIYGTLVRKAPSFLGFMARRIQRIYPAFLIVFALMMVMVIFIPIPGKLPANHQEAAVYVVANLALLPGLFPIEAIHGVTWSLSYEMFFYIAAAALVLGLGMSEMSRAWRIVIIALLAGPFVLVAYANIPYFPTRMMPFFAGMLLAESLGDRVPPWLAWAAPLVGFAALTSHSFPGTTSELIQTMAFFALCAVCFRGAGRISVWMTIAPLRWLGNMSYSYYLMHGIITRIIMVPLMRMLPLGMPDWLFWALLPVVYVATLVASSLLFVLVEKPISLRPPVKTIQFVAST